MLREGVLFHDGEVLDANDVKVTWDLHADPAAGSYYGEYNAEVIESVEVVDDLTVAFNLLEPYQLFIQDYINYFFVGAEHILSQVSPEEQQSSPIATGEDASMVVGTGPFRFVAWVPGEALEFERFDDYWGGQPYLDGIAFKFSDSQAALSAALQTGEVDFYPDVDAGIVPELEGAPVTISTAPGTSMRTILFNLDPEMSPFFQDVRVRQALMYALDTVAMTEASEFGYPTQPVGFLPEQNVLADPEALEMTYGYDPDQAMALLDEAGWVPGADGVRENGGQRLSFRLVHTDGDPARDIRALTAQEFWRQVGVETEIIIEPFQVHQERVRDNHDFDVSLENISANAYGDLSFYFQCDAYPDLGNWGRYCNEELDTLMDELNAAEDLEAKQEFVNQIQNVLLADLPRLPLNVSTEIGAINDRLHNVFFYAGHPYIAMHNWWVEA
jgi:peptide/nickel transport system substrate-binding protein